MDDDSLELDEYSPGESVVVGRRLPPGRMKFLPIISSPYREEIDTLLFREHMPVQQVHRWLEQEKGADISYMMLYRYARETEQRAIPPVVIETAQDEIRRNWSALGNIIQKGTEAVEKGVIPRPQEVLSAIRLQNEMLAKLGVGVNFQLVEESKTMLTRLVKDIVLPVLNDDQRKEILQRIMDDEDLSNWIIDEDPGLG